MSQSNDQSLRSALSLAKDKANAVLADSHTGVDAKNSISTLLKIAESYRDLVNASAGMGADMRLVKKRLDQVKSENDALAEQLAQLKKQVLRLATEVEMLGVEAGQIMKRNAHDPSSPDYGSAERIMTSALRVVDVVTQILQPRSSKTG